MQATDDLEIRRALAAGNKIAAIKRYRALTGVGLKEAKDAVEAIAVGRPVAPAIAAFGISPQSGHNTVIALLAAGNKIAAIKLYREAIGVGLEEAKEAVEALALRAAATGALRPIVERPRRGGGMALVIALVVGVAAAGIAFVIARGGK
jgi:ribosomal protein L7/L12